MKRRAVGLNKEMDHHRIGKDSNSRRRSTERFNREGLDKKRSSSKEKDHLLADIQDFFSSARKDLNRKSQ